jgi:sugar O-acyltransferase (sialic acid O-acetyltransferase NeuD family)
MNRPILIFGIGQVAEVFHYYVTAEGGRHVAAFTVDGKFLQKDSHLGIPVVDFETVEKHFPPADFDMLIAVSFKEVNQARQRKVAEASAKGYTLCSHVSPKAVVWTGFEPQPNTFIMENNVIQPYVTIGANVILWSGNHIGHHTAIEENCFIASHVVVSGNVRVGRNTFIGVNATLRDNIVIGKFNVIGAAALILADTPDEAVYLGAASTLARVPSSRLRGI